MLRCSSSTSCELPNLVDLILMDDYETNLRHFLTHDAREELFQAWEHSYD